MNFLDYSDSFCSPLSCRSRQERSNEPAHEFTARSASIQPRTSPLKFALACRGSSSKVEMLSGDQCPPGGADPASGFHIVSRPVIAARRASGPPAAPPRPSSAACGRRFFFGSYYHLQKVKGAGFARFLSQICRKFLRFFPAISLSSKSLNI